jgi:hypothetical protein
LVNSITWDHYNHLAIIYDCLTAEPRSRSQSWSLVQKIVLSLTVLREVLHAAFDDDMTGRTGTVSSTGMLKIDAVTKHHVKD